MGERYWITGVQLGMLIASVDADRIRLVEEITDKQFIGNAETLKELLKK